LQDQNSKADRSIEAFLGWKKMNGYSSYDQYDFWSTKYGIWSKGIFYKNKLTGSLFVAPIFVADIFFPVIRKFFTEKKRFPIADAHFMLAYINLYKYSSNAVYLKEAKLIAANLIKSSVVGFSGMCWGYPFDWMTTRGLWTSGVPLITTTGYCFEAFLKLFEATNEDRYREIAYSIFLFTLQDLKDTPIAENVASCSYSPIDNSQIVNANAYRSYVLVKGSRLFQNESALKKAKLNINFVLQSQREDGSWLYAVNDERDNFIDNFHTCFVLKNLIKVNDFLGEDRIAKAITKGFDFYKKNLLSEDYSPKPFAKLSRYNIVKKELYDYAEGISLCLQMQAFDKDAGKITEKLVNEVINKYQRNDGSYYTRISIFNIPNKIPYLRWSQSQIFYALTNYSLFNREI
jgi:hypothetical protein